MVATWSAACVRSSAYFWKCGVCRRGLTGGVNTEGAKQQMEQPRRHQAGRRIHRESLVETYKMTVLKGSFAQSEAIGDRVVGTKYSNSETMQGHGCR